MTDQELRVLLESSDFYRLDEKALKSYIRLLRADEKDLLVRIAEVARYAPPLDDVHQKNEDDPTHEELVATLENLRGRIKAAEEILAMRIGRMPIEMRTAA